MADPNEKSATPQALDRTGMIQAVANMEKENNSLKGKLLSSSPEKEAEVKAKNQELKTILLQLQKDLAVALVARKIPLDTAGISDKFQTLKTEALAHCSERNLDPTLWKKLESL